MVKAGKHLALGLLLACCFPWMALQAQDRRDDHWTMEHFMVNDGLPQNSVIDMAMDSMGYLWLTTEGGLVRYDGHAFRTFHLPDADVPSTERMRHLITTSHGELLVDDANRNLYMIHGHFAVIPLSGLRSGLTIKGGFPSAELLMELLGQSEARNGATPYDNLLMRVAPIDDHRWMAATRSEMRWYVDTALVKRTQLPFEPHALFAFNGRTYLNSIDGWWIMGEAGSLKQVKWKDGKEPVRGPQAKERSFWRNGEQHALFWNDEDLWILEPTSDPDMLSARSLLRPELENCTLNAALWSPAQNVLLLGTDVRGLFVFRERIMRTWSSDLFEGGKGNMNIYAQLPWGANSVLSFAGDGTVLSLSDDGSEVLPINAQRGCRSAVQPESGSVIYGSWDSLLLYSSRDERTTLLGRVDAAVRALLLEQDTLWVGTDVGISILTKGKLRTLHLMDVTSPQANIHFIARGLSNELLIGTCSGLLRYCVDGDTLIPHPGLETVCARVLQKHGDRLFIGTYSDGAYVVDGGSVRALPMDGLELLKHVHAFHVDKKGFLWMSTNQGLVRTSLSDLDTQLANPSLGLMYAYFRERAGLDNSEFNGGCTPAVVELADGRVAFPSLEGSVVFSPSDMPDQSFNNLILFENTYVDGSIWSVDDAMSLEPRTREIIFEYSIPYWGDQADLQLEYFVEGATETWVPMDVSSGRIVLSKMPYGEHLIRVRRTNGVPVLISDQEALWFEIRTPFFRSLPGMAILAFLAVISVLITLWAFSRRAALRNKELEAAIRARTLELSQTNEELHAAVKLKARMMSIITHDIVSPLRFMSRVARSSERALDSHDLVSVSHALKDMSETADKLHSTTDDMLQWMKHQEGVIHPQLGKVNLHALAAEVLDLMREQALNKNVVLKNLILPGEEITTDRNILTIVLRNLLTNAVNHTENGSVSISAQPGTDHWQFTITDTGIGMSAEDIALLYSIRDAHTKAHDQHSSETDQGLGYYIVSDLLQAINGTFEIDSEPGKGTRVVVRGERVR